MPSDTEIANFALRHIGSREISNIESDDTEEANACRRFYETARDEMLRDFAWPFATRYVALALVEEDPTSEWAYSYRYPSDALMVRRILSGTRMDSASSTARYIVAGDDTARVIYTGVEDAVAEYTVRADDTGYYPPDFVMALSYRLAAYIAPSLTGGDPFRFGPITKEMFDRSCGKAKRNAWNEERRDQKPESEFTSGR